MAARERARGGEELGERVRGLGGCVASRTGSRATRGSRRWLGGEAGGGRSSVGERHASPLLVLLAEEEEDKGGGDGLGRPGGRWAR